MMRGKKTLKNCTKHKKLQEIAKNAKNCGCDFPEGQVMIHFLYLEKPCLLESSL